MRAQRTLSLVLASVLAGGVTYAQVNRGWSEPEEGITVYLADNGIHADLLMPANAAGLDWRPLFPKSDFAAPDPGAQWIAFGMGEEQVYLNTPRWVDISPRTISVETGRVTGSIGRKPPFSAAPPVSCPAPCRRFEPESCPPSRSWRWRASRPLGRGAHRARRAASSLFSTAALSTGGKASSRTRRPAPA